MFTARRRALRLPLFGVLAALVLVVGVSAGQAGGGTPITACGQTVTTNAVLTQDLVCTGDGIVVGASGITIDLKGFTIRGDRGAGDYGIDDHLGYDDVAIKNGVAGNFNAGVGAYNGADQVSVSHLLASGNNGVGIDISGASASVRSSTASGNAVDGIFVEGDSAKIQSTATSGNGGTGIYVGGGLASVKSSTASGNRIQGITVVGYSATIQSSAASGNGVNGIAVNGDTAIIKGNRAEANGFFGGDSDLNGLGITASGYVTAPIGTNVARGNDALGQCHPAPLC
jgi:Right handed beta helix region